MKRCSSINTAPQTMKPLYIISHVACSQPGYLCEYLDQRNIHYVRISIESGDTLPQPDAVSGLVLLGAPISVNSDQPWIEQEMALIRNCAEKEIPVFGICFGGQLISKAFGGKVYPSPAMQIGWHPVSTTEQHHPLFNGTALPAHFHAFEWHEESFTLPSGALPLFSDEITGNQGFIYRSCLAVQFHPEVTPEIIQEWVARYEACVDKPAIGTQDHHEILLDVEQKLTAMRKITDLLFDWWIEQTRQVS
ncbi:MAG: type 1 glutamine amidotransferase [Sedimenticola selenatireducens]|uniref:Type 1 glutamine amidotransferase n=2 Tax=Sedimenticola selenatireducens TaxID=191960 RepID=A0A558DV66_9GAMM|nr:type 1 glutamine amidotransferase [Sedimenticola selenatireducens]TVT64798.1 MAG: type 1 glutamine amidotransferase [Sedimenticola selenatireducens]